MADTYGGTAVPISVPLAGVEVADPAITIVSEFAKAILNAHGQAAYASIDPAVKGSATGDGTIARPVVANAFGHDPSEEDFNEKDLPAVYVYRTGGERPYWLAEDYRVTSDTWTLLYIFRPLDQSKRARLHSFVNAIVKILDRGIEAMRDPNYVAPWDTDPTAGTTAPNPTAIMQAVASSTSPQTYSGLQLTGPKGNGSTLAPPQLPTVTVTGAACTGVVEFVGVGSDGQPRISRVTLAGIGTFVGDYQMASITEVVFPGLVNGATITCGLNGYTGRGTNILVLGGLMSFEIKKWRQFPWTLRMNDTSPQRKYPHAVEISLDVVERWVQDIVPVTSPAALDMQVPTDGAYNDDPLREEMILT